MVQVFCFAGKSDNSTPKLFVMEVGRDKSQGDVFKLKPQDIPFPPEAKTDFPVQMQVSPKHDVIYMITKFGFLYLFDIHSGFPLFRHRVSQQAIFVVCPHKATNGILGISAGGKHKIFFAAVKR